MGALRCVVCCGIFYRFNLLGIKLYFMIKRYHGTEE